MLDFRSFLERSAITGKQMPAQHSQAVNSIKDCVTEKPTENKGNNNAMPVSPNMLL